MCFTFVSLVTYWGLEGSKVVSLFPGKFPIKIEDDSYFGGDSNSSIDINEGIASVHCNIVKGSYRWPYCAINIDIATVIESGIDISEFDVIRFDIDKRPSHKGRAWAARIYVENKTSKSEGLDWHFSHNNNGIEFNSRQHIIEIPIDKLEVMSWWLLNNKQLMKKKDPEFDNVSSIQIATIANIPPGNYHFYLNTIELIGNPISKPIFYSTIFSIWLVYGIYCLLHELTKNKKKVRYTETQYKYMETQKNKYMDLAFTDALTGALNRHGIRQWLMKYEVMATQPYMGVLYLDIDHFKAINDQYGHKVGDEVLKQFSSTIEQVVNPVYRLTRWGGEEFIVFCPGIGFSELIELAESIRQRVELNAWVQDIPVTCSVGVELERGDGVFAAVSRADQALYRAKQCGRNCVQIYRDTILNNVLCCTSQGKRAS